MFSKKNIITIICFLVALGIIIFPMALIWQSVKSLKKEVGEKKAALAIVEDLVVSTNQIKKWGTIEKEAAKIFLAVPEQKDIPGLLVQFEALASANGLVLESVNFGQINEAAKRGALGVNWDASEETGQKPKGPFQELKIDLSLSGAYIAFKNFLGALENNIRAVNVSSIDFSGQRALEEASSDFFEFHLKVVVYYK